MFRFALLILAVLACTAEIIDRVAVVLGNSVITESEIMREIRLTAFLNGEPLDFSPAAKKKAAERLVDQHLIGAELRSISYGAPDPDEIEEMFQQTRSNFSSEAKFREEMERTGVTEKDLKAHLARQINTLSFLDFRFRPGIQISDDEVAKYFDEKIAPGLRKAPSGAEPSVDDYRSKIEETLMSARLDQASDAWLKEAHERTHIEYRPDVFTAESKENAVK